MMQMHWLLVVMDHNTRRIIGFGIQAGIVNERRSRISKILGNRRHGVQFEICSPGIFDERYR
jgi:hypothetical protein